MKKLTLLLLAGASLTIACDGGKDTGPDSTDTTDTSTDTTDTSTDTTDTSTVGASVSGNWNVTDDTFTVIGDWSVSGTTVACSGCVYEFDGNYTVNSGGGDDFAVTTTIIDDPKYAGYVLVYGGSDFWGYGVDDGSYTYFTNYGYVYYGVTSTGYYGGFTR